MRNRILCALCALVVAATLGGCGTGGSPTGSGGRAVLTITWPERSRLIPAASNSIRVAFSLAGTPLQTQVLPRPAVGNTTQAAFSNLKVGTLTLRATAYPTTDGTGTAQADATTTVSIQDNVTTPVTLTMASTIDHFAVTPTYPQVMVGKSQQLSADAKDAAGNTVLVTAANITWDSLDKNIATVSATGMVAGVAAGAARITVTDTESGKTATVSVTVPDIRYVSIAANDYAWDAVSQRIYVTLSSASPQNPNTVTIVDPATATIGQSIAIGQDPSRVRVTDDGKYLYTWLAGERSMCRMNLTTLTPDIKWTVGGSPIEVEDFAVVPGQSRAVAVSREDRRYSPRHIDVVVYDDTTPRPKTAAGANSIQFGASGSRIYGYHSEISDWNFVRWNVDATGIVSGDIVHFLTGPQGFIYNAGRIYGSNGGVYDPEAVTQLGTIPGGPMVPDGALGRVWVMSADTILAYDTTTFNLVGQLQIAGTRLVTPIRWGATGIAVYDTNTSRMILLTRAPGL